MGKEGENGGEDGTDQQDASQAEISQTKTEVEKLLKYH